jgi:hypothetical protein
MHYCCVTRLNYLLQCVPYSVAPEPYDRAYKDILKTWQTLADVTHDELNLPFVRERVALPFASGGQNITDSAEALDRLYMHGDSFSSLNHEQLRVSREFSAFIGWEFIKIFRCEVLDLEMR